MEAKNEAHRRLGAQLLLLVLSVVYFVHIISVYRPFSFLAYDPGWQATAVQSLVQDGDLDLKNQLGADPREASDQTALGVQGEWYPLHEWLMPFVSVPFYLAFGLNGCLLVNVICMLGLCLGSYALALRYSAVWSAFVCALVLGTTAACVAYSYSFSIDVMGAALAVWAVWAVFEERPASAGILCGLAVLARTTNAPLAVLCLCYTAFRRFKTGSPSALRFMLGAAPFALLFFCVNQAMFGSPFTVAYDRWAQFADGGVSLIAQSERFGRPSLAALAELLYSGRHSLLFMHPLGFAGFILGWLWLREKAPEGVLIYAVAVQTLLTVAAYGALAFPGGVGNRYLFTLCAFGTALFAVPLNSLFRFAHTRGRRAIKAPAIWSDVNID